jgi:uncharacterized membrane protein
MPGFNEPQPILLYRRLAKKVQRRPLTWSLGGMLWLTTFVGLASAVLRNYAFWDAVGLLIGLTVMFAAFSPIIVCVVLLISEGLQAARDARRETAGAAEGKPPRRLPRS